MRARVTALLKQTVLDPQGNAIQNALHHLDFTNVASVRQGKVFEILLPDMDQDKALQQVQAMCEQLLVNTIVEEYSIDFLPEDE